MCIIKDNSSQDNKVVNCSSNIELFKACYSYSNSNYDDEEYHSEDNSYYNSNYYDDYEEQIKREQARHDQEDKVQIENAIAFAASYMAYLNDGGIPL